MKRAKPKPKTTPSEPEAPAVEVHTLKAWPETYDPIESGIRTFDLRLDDGRRFREGDVIQYVRWDPRTKQRTGATMRRKIVYLICGLSETIARDPRWGLKASYVLMSLVETQ